MDRSVDPTLAQIFPRASGMMCSKASQELGFQMPICVAISAPQRSDVHAPGLPGHQHVGSTERSTTLHLLHYPDLRLSFGRFGAGIVAMRF